ncbi:hypothetical protein GCM10009801_75070 [Streptomyces albiaxialis]|uniref:Integral membrane protein n=1 Tax=Streptomyces albiaxialis TaxID=329523 RepID=A0ABN2X012_9ACTN
MSTAHEDADFMARSGSARPFPRLRRSGGGNDGRGVREARDGREVRDSRDSRDALGSALAGGYLVVCAALLIWAVVVSNGDNPDASFAGVIPVLATAPASLVFLVLPDHASALYLAVGLGALVNAALIHWCVRALRRGLGRSGADR